MLSIDLGEHRRDDAPLSHLREHEHLVGDPTRALERLTKEWTAALAERKNVLGG